MVKRKNNNIDEILERYLPRASDSEVQSARDRFLVFLQDRRQLQEAIDNFTTKLGIDSDNFVSLGYVEQLALAAVYLLRDEATSVRIAEKMNELTPGKVIDAGAVFVALDGLERGRLLATRPANTPKKGYKPTLLFTVTPDGERMLVEIRASAKRLMEALHDVATRT
jgi:hypothetical protein